MVGFKSDGVGIPLARKDSTKTSVKFCRHGEYPMSSVNGVHICGPACPDRASRIHQGQWSIQGAVSEAQEAKVSA